MISEIGVLFSSICVAYGFSRFRIPGGKYIFFLLIATIMIGTSLLVGAIGSGITLRRFLKI